IQSEPDVIGLLETAIHKANEAIWTQSQENKDQQGMGTTLTGCVILGDSMYLSQVGDSRGYVLRKGQLVQMTRDQSLIGQLIEEGTLTEEQAEKLGGKNIILQALGVEETLKIDSKRYDILRDDVILLCSDGLNGFTSDENIERILNENEDLQVAAKKLIEAAYEGGGKDNITVIVGRFEGEGLREPLTAASGDDLAGAAYKAPEAIKSNAGRNAVIATVVVLAAIAAWIFKPTNLKIQVTTNVPATVTLSSSGEGALEDFGEQALECQPGETGVTFEVPRGYQFQLTAASEGYSPPGARSVNSKTDRAIWPETFELELIPARTLKIVPPTVNGRLLTGIEVTLTQKDNAKREPQVINDLRTDEKPNFEQFPAGTWTAAFQRTGFEPAEMEIVVESKADVKEMVPALTEIKGPLKVVGAGAGSSVQVLDGEEPLMAQPAKVGPDGSASVEARATTVTVRVTGPSMRPFEATVTIGGEATAEVSLAEHLGKVKFGGSPGDKAVLTPAGGGKNAILRVKPGETATNEADVLPGTWDAKVTLRNGTRFDGRIEVAPGQIIEMPLKDIPKK
ncbi:MAG: protein phosphatase 2C domain-containing protein, partial [Planctomycetota bacterium]